MFKRQTIGNSRRKKTHQSVDAAVLLRRKNDLWKVKRERDLGGRRKRGQGREKGPAQMGEKYRGSGF